MGRGGERWGGEGRGGEGRGGEGRGAIKISYLESYQDKLPRELSR